MTLRAVFVHEWSREGWSADDGVRQWLRRLFVEGRIVVLTIRLHRKHSCVCDRITSHVVLLNLLVAMINDTSNMVSAGAHHQWQLERARIIHSIECELQHDPPEH